MKKIYVGNLPYSATEDQLRALFTEHGAIESVAVITDRQTGRARGQRMTVAEWVRQALRAARQREPLGDAPRKLEVVRAAAPA